MIRKILSAKEPSLRSSSRQVTKVDKKVKEVIKDLKDTLAAQKDPEGVGLAAPQIGKNVRIFVVDYEGVKRVVINPKVLETKKGKNNSKAPFEGCLSIPHYYGPLKRPGYIKIAYTNEGSKKVTEEFVGFYAHIIQHEMDHLDGVLFVDKLLKAGLPLYKQNNGEWEEVEI